ncbi:DUF262 domain-containing protein [Spiroplasma chrysopicola]|uniref:GmrSD restriction endonucleases N-terminal domain-containing protein n=1 Tax=Spiroplasma chrysopicola DF-1 TaxID=1276227 RepID=R4U1R4_9MOLU|nr:DUF262 domain-containing protein [Spiroplasma chrysopicola]AGM25262.1 hypothetical protein SCHRY_v1c06860 [Spiroplasma chrysopicola DF-1]
MEEKIKYEVEAKPLSKIIDDLIDKSFEEKNLKSKIVVPRYQRSRVWKKENQERFLDSLKMGYPFGTFIFYEKNDGSFDIVDGYQRLSTIKLFITNPNKFIRHEDIDPDNEINELMNNANISTNKSKVYDELLRYIKDYLINLSKENFEHIQIAEIVNYLKSKLSFLNADTELTEKLNAALKEPILNFTRQVSKLNNIKVPVITCSGNPGALPFIFEQVNTGGIKLNKYDIAGATWSNNKVKCLNTDIIDNIIKKYEADYDDVEKNDNSNDDTTTSGQINRDIDLNSIKKGRNLNLYEYIYGFARLLESKYPELFKPSKKDNSINEAGFIIFNACVGNKIHNISNLNAVIEKRLENWNKGEMLNAFTENIFEAINIVRDSLKVISNFKNNKQKHDYFRPHTVTQLASIITDVFYSLYGFEINNETPKFNSQGIYSVKISEIKNKDWKIIKNKYKKNLIKKYIIDILGNDWQGSGDNRLVSIMQQPGYYMRDIAIEDVVTSANYYFESSLSNDDIVKKNPTEKDKVILSLIYSNAYSFLEANSSQKYEFDHIVSGNYLMNTISEFKKQNKGLPINSIANFALVTKEINILKSNEKWANIKEEIKKLLEKKPELKEKTNAEYLEKSIFLVNNVDFSFYNEKENFDNFSKKYKNFLKTRWNNMKIIFENSLKKL